MLELHDNMFSDCMDLGHNRVQIKGPLKHNYIKQIPKI